MVFFRKGGREMKINAFLATFVLALVLITPAGNAATPKNMVVHFIDIGQGDAIYIKMPSGEDVVIDAGNKAKGKEVVAYLKKQKVDDIEVMIASHPDADHLGGLDEVLKAYKVESIYAPKVSHTTQAYKDFLTAVKNEKVTIKTAKMDVTIPFKEKTLKAKFLGPVKEYSKSDLNNWSAVLHINYDKTNFLFTGDAELKSEQDMIAKKLVSKVDVLKVGHHGSKDSSSKDFLALAKPIYSIISVGAKNQYKLPTSDTLNRLKAIKTNVFRTDQKGTITVTSDGKKVSLKTEKK
jgi:competence protein ComEC